MVHSARLEIARLRRAMTSSQVSFLRWYSVIPALDAGIFGKLLLLIYIIIAYYAFAAAEGVVSAFAFEPFVFIVENFITFAAGFEQVFNTV